MIGQHEAIRKHYAAQQIYRLGRRAWCKRFPNHLQAVIRRA
jgi:hypothetical protein